MPKSLLRFFLSAIFCYSLSLFVSFNLAYSQENDPSFKDTKAQEGYIIDLKELIKRSKDKIDRVDDELKDLAKKRRNQQREEKAREYYQKAMSLYEDGKFEEARKFWEKAVEVTNHPEMKDYVRESIKKAKATEKMLQQEEIRRVKRLELERGYSVELVEKSYDEAIRLYKQKNYIEAKLAFERVEDMFPDHKATRSYLMIIQQEIQKEQEKIIQEKLKEEAIAKQKEKEIWRNELERKEQERQQTVRQQAESAYQQALSFYKSRQFENAKEKFKEVEWIIPDYKATLQYLSRIDQDISDEILRQKDEKHEQLRKQLKDEKLVAIEEQERLLKRQDEERRAAQERLEDEADFVYRAAESLYKHKMYQEAENKFLEVAKIAPHYKRTDRYLDKISKIQEKIAQSKRESMQESRQYASKAQQEQDDRISQLAEDDRKDNEAGDLYSSAIQLYRAGQYEEAKAHFEGVNAIRPRYRSTERYLQKIDKALAKSQELIQRVDQQESVSDKTAGKDYVAQSKRTARAEELVIQRAEEERQERLVKEVDVKYQSALKFYRDKNYEEAKLKFIQVEALYPGYKDTVSYLGRIDEDIIQARAEPRKTKEDYVPFQRKTREKSKVEQKEEIVKEHEVQFEEETNELYERAIQLFNDEQFVLAKERFEEVGRLTPGYQDTDKFLAKIEKKIKSVQQARVSESKLQLAAGKDSYAYLKAKERELEGIRKEQYKEYRRMMKEQERARKNAERERKRKESSIQQEVERRIRQEEQARIRAEQEKVRQELLEVKEMARVQKQEELEKKRQEREQQIEEDRQAKEEARLARLAEQQEKGNKEAQENAAVTLPEQIQPSIVETPEVSEVIEGQDEVKEVVENELSERELAKQERLEEKARIKEEKRKAREAREEERLKAREEARLAKQQKREEQQKIKEEKRKEREQILDEIQGAPSVELVEENQPESEQVSELITEATEASGEFLGIDEQQLYEQVKKEMAAKEAGERRRQIQKEQQRLMATQKKELNNHRNALNRQLLLQGKNQKARLKDSVHKLYLEAYELYKMGHYGAARAKFSMVDGMYPGYKSAKGYVNKINKIMAKEDVTLQKEVDRRKKEALKQKKKEAKESSKAVSGEVEDLKVEQGESLEESRSEDAETDGKISKEEKRAQREEERQAKLEAKRQAQEEAQKQKEELRKQLEEERQAKLEAKRQAQEEAQKQKEELRKQREEERQAKLEAKRQAQEEAQKQKEELRKQQEEARIKQQEELALRKQQEEEQRMAAAKAAEEEKRLQQEVVNLKKSVDQTYQEALHLYEDDKVQLSHEKFRQFEQLLGDERLTDEYRAEFKKRLDQDKEKVQKEIARKEELERRRIEKERKQQDALARKEQIRIEREEKKRLAAEKRAKEEQKRQEEERLKEDRLAYERVQREYQLEQDKIAQKHQQELDALHKRLEVQESRLELERKREDDRLQKEKTRQLELAKQEAETKRKEELRLQREQERQARLEDLEALRQEKLRAQEMAKNIKPNVIEEHAALAATPAVPAAAEQELTDEQIIKELSRDDIKFMQEEKRKELKRLVSDRQEEIQAERERVREEFNRNVDKLYTKALKLQEQGFLEQSRGLLQEIQKLSPNYKDSAKILSKIDQQMTQQISSQETPATNEPPLESVRNRDALIADALDSFK